MNGPSITLSIKRGDGLAPSYTGWSVSLFLHGLAIILSILLVSDLRLPPQSPSFKWEVALNEPTPLSPPTPELTKIVAAIKPSPAKAEPVQPRLVERKVQTVDLVQQLNQRVARISVNVRAVIPTVRTVSQEVQTVTTAVQSVPAAHTVSSRESYPVSTAKTAEIGHVAEVGSQAVSRPPAHTSNGMAFKGTVSEPALAAGTSSIISHPALEGAMNVRASSLASMRPTNARSAPAPQADFNWLIDAIRDRTEGRKGYPLLALANRWEGTVTLRINVRPEKKELLLVDATIDESSGYSLLDTHALEVVQQAFPLPLKHGLERPQTFTYQMEFYMAR